METRPHIARDRSAAIPNKRDGGGRFFQRSSFLRSAGVTEFAVHPRSLMMDGKMQDQMLVGKDRPAERT